MILLQPHDVASISRFERHRAIRRREARVELPRLGDGAAGQLVARYPGREAEIVLDPPRGARLPAETGAVHHQRLEALRSAVHRGAQAGGAGADHEQVDLLAGSELEADSERARDLAGRRAAQLSAARQPDQRQARLVELRDQWRRSRIVVRVTPAERQAVAAGEVEQLHGGLRGVRAYDFEAEALDRL